MLCLFVQEQVRVGVRRVGVGVCGAAGRGGGQAARRAGRLAGGAVLRAQPARPTGARRCTAPLRLQVQTASCTHALERVRRGVAWRDGTGWGGVLT